MNLQKVYEEAMQAIGAFKESNCGSAYYDVSHLYGINDSNESKLVSTYHKNWDAQRLILSHEFAKLFWNEEQNYGYEYWKISPEETGSDYSEGTLEEWQFHLQQMILYEEPLYYIRKFLWIA